MLLLILFLLPCVLAEEKVHVSVFGLGAMGCALASAVSKMENVKLSVWNRSAGKCLALPSEVQRFEKIETALESASIAIFTVTSSEHVLQFFEQDSVVNAARGTIVVSLASTSIEGAKKQEEKMATCLGKESFLGGAMMCSPNDFEAGGCSIWLGGSDSTWDKVKFFFEKLGMAQLVGKTAAAAAAYDLAFIFPMVQALHALQIGMAVAEKAGFDPEFAVKQFTQTLPYLAADFEKWTSISTRSTTVDEFKEHGKTGITVGSSLAYLQQAEETCKSLGVGESACNHFSSSKNLYQPLSEAGLDSAHQAIIYKHFLDPKLSDLLESNNKEKIEL